MDQKMDRAEAMRAVCNHLKREKIRHRLLNEGEEPVDVTRLNTLYFAQKAPMLPGGYLESTIRFCEQHLYSQTYFSESVVRTAEETARAAGLIAFCNRYLDYYWNSLYEHVWHLDEEGEIFSGVHMRYELMELHLDESLRHITEYPFVAFQRAGSILLGYVKGRCTLEEAKKNILAL